LSQQWIDELTRHTPSLKVLVYPGWKSLSVKHQEKEATKTAEVTDTDDTNIPLLDSWAAYINDFDVCVTTYDTLRQDLAVARVVPSRPVRQMTEYSRNKRPISPLVTCEWYRVIMDEVWVTSYDTATSRLTHSKVQMVGGGKASCVPLFTLSDIIQLFALASARWCLSSHASHHLPFLVHPLEPVFPTYPMFSS
jgi:hypothetical protein